MKKFSGQALSWDVSGGVTELALHREPCNEIGSLTLEELEKFVAALEDLRRESHTLIIYSTLSCGFCAGADLRELYRRSHEMERAVATKGVRDYLERIHRVMNTIDAAPLTTIAAVHGVAVGTDSGVWRDSAAEAGFGKCGGTRSAAHGAQFQCGKGATDWLGEPGRRRRRGIADGAGYGGAAWKV